MSNTIGERGNRNRTSCNNSAPAPTLAPHRAAGSDQGLSKFAVRLNTFALTGCASMSGALFATLFTQSLPIIVGAMIAGAFFGRYIIKRFNYVPGAGHRSTGPAAPPTPAAPDAPTAPAAQHSRHPNTAGSQNAAPSL